MTKNYKADKFYSRGTQGLHYDEDIQLASGILKVHFMIPGDFLSILNASPNRLPVDFDAEVDMMLSKISPIHNSPTEMTFAYIENIGFVDASESL